MNKQSFCRYFKQRMSLTFSQFVNELRIKYACELLVGNHSGIAQVAYESGFENLSYFNRQFKRIKGVTPREFKSKIIDLESI